MPQSTKKPIVTDANFSLALDVIEAVRRNTRHTFLLDAKLGSANDPPLTDTEIAAAYQTPATSIGPKWARIVDAMKLIDQEHRNPLRQIAERANAAMASAGIINRHNRRPPLYAESTLETFAKLGFAVPEHLPLIRAAGHLAPPPVVPASHNIDSIISDIAEHVARSHEPQSTDEIIQSLGHHQEALDAWPQLELSIFIDRVADIRPDDRGLYHPDQPWGNFMTTQRLVASTMLRILARDQKPSTTAYLVDEIKRLASNHLPDGYNILNAVHNFAYASEEVHRQSRSTFGLMEWYDATDVQNAARPRGKTGDIAHAFLLEHGPSNVEDVIEHVHRVARTTRRTVQEVINHDPAGRLIRLSDRRVAANPILRDYNPGTPSLAVVPDEHSQPPTPVLRESEFLWLTRYIEALNGLNPPLPVTAALTGSRAAGFTRGEPMQITVVVADCHRHCLEPRLEAIAADASQAAPSVQPSINVLSSPAWERRDADTVPVAYHKVWMRPDPAE